MGLPDPFFSKIIIISAKTCQLSVVGTVTKWLHLSCMILVVCHLWVAKEMMQSTKVILLVLLSLTFQKFAQCLHKIFQFEGAEAVYFGAES